MQFNRHDNLSGQHAFLSPSKYYWVDYDAAKLKDAYRKQKAVSEGVETHDFARRCIERGVKLPRKKATLNLYVNDAIRCGLTPEVTLYYSENCFGTADAIGYFEDRNVLMVFDLKTGESKASMKQLYIYAALCCLEYGPVIRLNDEFQCILRIYQLDEIREERLSASDIVPYMEAIVESDAIIEDEKVM